MDVVRVVGRDEDESQSVTVTYQGSEGGAHIPRITQYGVPRHIASENIHTQFLSSPVSISPLVMAYMKRRLSDFMIPGPKSTLPNDGTSARDISQTDTPHHGGIPLAPSNDVIDTGPSSSQWPFYQSSGPDILQGSTTTDQDHIPTRITPLTYDPTLHRAG